MTETSPRQEGWRYARGAVFAIFIPPLLIGVPIALTALFAAEAAGILIIPMALFYGAIIATPFVGAGTILFMLLARFIRPRWWHSALIGALLIVAFLLATDMLAPPWDDNAMQFAAASGLFGALSGFIYWYFARPAKQAGRGNVEQ